MGTYVINIDGSVLSDSGAASAGGLLRNNKGEWIRGFLINIGLTDSLNAELWGVRQGLKVARELGLSNVILQTDAAVVVTLLTTGMDYAGHPLGVLLEDCKRLIVSFSNLTVKHVFREANKCADKLANLAHGVDQGIIDLVSPP